MLKTVTPAVTVSNTGVTVRNPENTHADVHFSLQNAEVYFVNKSDNNLYFRGVYAGSVLVCGAYQHSLSV